MIYEHIAQRCFYRNEFRESMTELQDVFQLQALRSGDSRAVKVWYQTYASRLIRYVQRKISDRKDVEEIVQDTFMSCMESLPLYQEKSSLWTWMCSVANHEVADALRKKYAKKVLSALPFAEHLLPPAMVDMHGLSHAVRIVLQKMSAREREVLLLKYVDRKSVGDIARILGKSVKSAESVLFRARKSFRLIFVEEERSNEF